MGKEEEDNLSAPGPALPYPECSDARMLGPARPAGPDMAIRFAALFLYSSAASASASTTNCRRVCSAQVVRGVHPRQRHVSA